MKSLKVATVLIVAGAAATAQAQAIRPAYSYPAEPPKGGIEIADTPLFISPYIGFGAGHDDNLFMSNVAKKGSTVTITSPGFRIDARRPGMVFLASYQGQIGHYFDSDNDNYVDHVFDGQLDTAFDRRTFLRIGYNYVYGHDPRGSTDRPISSHPDKYWLSTPRATFAFGAPGAEGRVELYASSAKKQYTNNRETTGASDRTTNEGGGAFYWRVAPKTYALVEARETKIDYVVTSPSAGNERRYFVGVSWEATAATSGTLKYGRLRRSFDGDAFPEETSSAWEGAIDWVPLTYSHVSFLTSRSTNESTGLGSFILTSVGSVTWTHDWTSYVRTGVNLRYTRDQYQGFDRTDNTKSLGFKLGYQFRPWLTLGAEYMYTKRDSNIDAFDYDRNQYLLTATAAM